MSDLSAFPITKRWRAKHPDRLQLYSLPTPNGVKVSIMLEEVGSRLGGRQWIMDENYSIADISMLGWVRNLIGFYGARELVGFDSFGNVAAWLDRGLARPAVKRGLEIPKRP